MLRPSGAHVTNATALCAQCAGAEHESSGRLLFIAPQLDREGQSKIGCARSHFALSAVLDFDFDFTSPAALLGGLVFVLMVLLWLRRLASGSGRSAKSADYLDTIQAWPPQAVRLMTTAQRKAYDCLRHAAPRGHVVLAQVPLLSFISVPTKHPHGQWLNRAGRLCVDLMVCDSSSRVVAAVNVRDANESKRTIGRHESLTKNLEAARIPVQTWQTGALPGEDDVRTWLRATMPIKSDVVPQFDDRRLLPQPEIQEVRVGDGRGRAMLRSLMKRNPKVGAH